MSIRMLFATTYRQILLAFVILSTLLILAIFSFSTARADIPPVGTYEDRRDYYSDASKTTLVGGWRYDCYGEITTWGTKTNYINYTRIPCQ